MHLFKLFVYIILICLLLHLLWFRPIFYWITYISTFKLLIYISWIIGSYIYEKIHIDTISSDNKIVLITGCDSGFGHALAQRLDSYGFCVYAGVLYPEGEGAKVLRSQCSNRVRVVKLDVTKPDEVGRVVHLIKQTKSPLWAVVNNAGIGIGCPFEWGNDVKEYQKLLDVNVLGLIRVTKSCILLLRHSNGRIVNVSSLASRVSMPQMSHYSLSKASVRALTDSIRREPLNASLKVILIEPTIYSTPITSPALIKRDRARVYSETPDEIKVCYGQRYFDSIRNSGKNVKAYARNNIDEVVNAMVDAVRLTRPKSVYWCCGWIDTFLMHLAVHMPEPLVDLAIRIEQKKFCRF